MLTSILHTLYDLTISPLWNVDVTAVLLTLMPLVLFFEIPMTLFTLLGIIKYRWERSLEGERQSYFPAVSCIVTCYNEGLDIAKTVISLTEQIYPGAIQLILVIDGATINAETLKAAKSMEGWVNSQVNRSMMVVPKWQRGGMVSSANLALQFVTGTIVIKVDGDTSFDNNMVERATRHFADDEVVAVSGCLRVRNAEETLCAAFQAIEYFVAIQASKTALSAFNTVNNISGAFGIFRRELLDLVEGWDAGTAEDLDMTMRIKNYFARAGKTIRIVFDPEAICFTDVPATFGRYLKQRIRWEGDFPFILFKHRRSISPAFWGWPNFIGGLIGIFIHLVIPAMVFVYMIWLFHMHRLEFAIALLIAIYGSYVLMISIIYFLSVCLLSERKMDDLSRVPLLPLMPLFLLAAKINAFIAILWELFGKGHQDSSMAPWWVLRKSRF